MRKQTMVIIGVVLIIAAVVAVIASESMYETASGVARTYGPGSQYNEARTAAAVVRYGGIGAGVIGGILFLAGLLKNRKE